MEHDEAKALLTSYLNCRMRVVISDGRVIDGRFLCTDSDRNIVLGSCEEFFCMEEIVELEAAKGTGTSRQSRTLGLAIVPGAHIKSISLALSDEPVSTETLNIEGSETKGSETLNVEGSGTLNVENVEGSRTLNVENVEGSETLNVEDSTADDFSKPLEES